MTFSELATVLYPYCHKTDSDWEYVILLTDKIMGGQPGRANGNETYQNPMRNKEERTLLAYLNGERSISRCDASMILGRIDKKKFAKYVRWCCREDSEMSLLAALEERGFIEDKHKNMLVSDICADLFEQVLYGLARKTEKKAKV